MTCHGQIARIVCVWLLTATVSSAQRVSDGLILLYEFNEFGGNIVMDTSGFGMPFDLTIQDLDRVSWGPGRLTVNENTIITNPDPANKVFDAVAASEEITVEAWVLPESNTLIGASRIVNYGPDQETVNAEGLEPPLVGNHANLSLGTINADIQWRFRNTGPGNTTFGAPNIGTAGSGPVVLDPPQLMHLVATRSADGAS